ncbi:MAG TPA: hypothetical protein VGB09_03405 [Candidatus Binatia bacterium]|jgi:hypothetical protein
MQIDADINFQRRVWNAQRVGWIIIGVVVVAGLLGLFGTGPLSRASAQGSGLRLEYERFGRLQQPTRLRFLLPESKLDAEVSISRDYLEAVRIEQITPEPREVAVAGRWLIYRFSGPGPLAVTLDLVPLDFGGLEGAAEIPPADALAFRQFIYP